MGSSAQMTPKRKIKPMLKVILDSFLMPFFKPLTTEMQATPVMTQMMRPLVVSESALMSLLRRFIAVAIVVTPSPRDVHTPKVVHEMESASIKSPMRPLTFSPRSGKKAARIVIGRP